MRWALATICVLGCSDAPGYAVYDLVEPSTGGVGGVPAAPGSGGAGGPGTATGGADQVMVGGTGGASAGGSGGSAAPGGQTGDTGGAATGGSSTGTGGDGAGGDVGAPAPMWSWERNFDGLWNAPGVSYPVPHYGFIQLSFRVECQGDTYHYAGVSSPELPSGYSGELELEPTSEGQRAIMNCASPREIHLLVRRRIRMTSSGVDTTESTQAAMAISPDLSIQRIRLVVEDLSWFAPDGETTGVHLVEKYRWEVLD